ncbi:MAG: nucleotide exchange factor GrpE [Herpetosiphon sp.]
MSLAEAQIELESAREEANEYRAKYFQTLTLTEQLRKQAAEGVARAIAARTEAMGRPLLEVGDNLERALLHAASDDPLRVGVEATLTLLRGVLEQHGIMPIPVAPGTAFDPRFHEAIEGQSAAVEHETVVRVVQGGYVFDGHVLRPAQVVVAIPQTRNSHEQAR